MEQCTVEKELDFNYPDMRFITSAWIDWQEVSPDSYFRNIPALIDTASFPFSSQITFLTGENGTGKSSLLEAIAAAMGFRRDGGMAKNYTVADQTATQLGRACHLEHRHNVNEGFFFRAETFFNIASQLPLTRDIGITGRKLESYKEMSHGEGFLEFLQSRQYAGLYLMDEPEAALSPQRQLTLLLHLYYMAHSGSQFIIVTHSPILMGLPGSSILRFDDNGMEECEWEDTESYKISKMFLDERELVLHHLFSIDDC